MPSTPETSCVFLRYRHSYVYTYTYTLDTKTNYISLVHLCTLLVKSWKTSEKAKNCSKYAVREDSIT